jgi:hypothetical protein
MNSDFSPIWFAALGCPRRGIGSDPCGDAAGRPVEL